MFLNAIFFHTFLYKYGKKLYSTVQVRETNTFRHLRVGEVSFCTNCRNSLNEEALPPHLVS